MCNQPSQNDSKTLEKAEDLLKQFDSNMKQKVEDDRNAAVVGSIISFDSLRSTESEAGSTSRRSPGDLNNTPVFKIENIYETNARVNYKTQVTSKQIQEAVG